MLLAVWVKSFFVFSSVKGTAVVHFYTLDWSIIASYGLLNPTLMWKRSGMNELVYVPQLDCVKNGIDDHTQLSPAPFEG